MSNGATQPIDGIFTTNTNESIHFYRSTRALHFFTTGRRIQRKCAFRVFNLLHWFFVKVAATQPSNSLWRDAEKKIWSAILWNWINWKKSAWIWIEVWSGQNSQSIIKNLSHVLLFQNLSFLFLPVNLESGLTSFPFLLARSWKFSIPYLFCFLRCFHEVKRPSHLLLLNPVPAFLDTFPPNILHLLSPTFKPWNKHAILFYSRWWSPKASTCRLSPTLSWSSSPCSNTSCSSLLSKCCWQRLGSSSHQHEEEFLRLELHW